MCELIRVREGLRKYSSLFKGAKEVPNRGNFFRIPSYYNFGGKINDYSGLPFYY